VVNKVVERSVEVPRVVEVLPPLPECSNFDFNPEIGGMTGSQLIVYTFRLYKWGSQCSSALSSAD